MKSFGRREPVRKSPRNEPAVRRLMGISRFRLSEADEGAALALLDLDATRLAQTADQLPGTRPLTLVADVTDEAAVDDAFARIGRCAQAV